MSSTFSAHGAVLQVDDLQFSYPGYPLFQRLSFALPYGVTLVLGGDGRGKSTLLRLLAGATCADGGKLAIHGVALHEQPEAYRRQLFWIAPREESFDQLTVQDFFALQKQDHPAFDEALLPAVMAGLSLTPHQDKQLFMLSTGSKRKVWLAAAFASRAAVILLDDPFAGLDRASINFFVDQLRPVAKDSSQAWVLAMYEAPSGLALAHTVELGA